MFLVLLNCIKALKSPSSLWKKEGEKSPTGQNRDGEVTPEHCYWEQSPETKTLCNLAGRTGRTSIAFKVPRMD